MRALWVVAALVACGTPREEPALEETPPVGLAAPAESLASQPMPGVEVWFMEGRTSQDSSGRDCYERTLEIRDSTGRRQVPLLYTLEAPSALDDSSILARVFLHCRAGASYRVSLRTGLPTPLRQ